MTPYYQDDFATIYWGDCREILSQLGPVDLVLTDPPYGDTALEWDVKVDGWLPLLPSQQLWCFGSMRFFLYMPFSGWRYIQEIIWEKENGSSFVADRFKRVHEFALHFSREDVAWSDLYKSPVFTFDGTPKKSNRFTQPPHTGKIGNFKYISDGRRLICSVLHVQTMHGRAEHPTQKPIGILRPLIEYSCPPGGSVLDPFMGSGTTLVAAKELGRKSIGIEVEEKYCKIAVQRLTQEILPFAPKQQPQQTQTALFNK